MVLALFPPILKMSINGLVIELASPRPYSASLTPSIGLGNPLRFLSKMPQ